MWTRTNPIDDQENVKSRMGQLTFFRAFGGQKAVGGLPFNYERGRAGHYEKLESSFDWSSYVDDLRKRGCTRRSLDSISLVSPTQKIWAANLSTFVNCRVAWCRDPSSHSTIRSTLTPVRWGIDCIMKERGLEFLRLSGYFLLIQSP